MASATWWRSTGRRRGVPVRPRSPRAPRRRCARAGDERLPSRRTSICPPTTRLVSRWRACGQPGRRLTVSEVFALTRFGELTSGQGGLLVNPTEVARPGPGGRGRRGEQTRCAAGAGRRRRRAGTTVTPALSLADHAGPGGRRASFTAPTGARLRRTGTGDCSRPTGPPRAPSRPKHSTGRARRRWRRPAGGRVQRAQLLPDLHRAATPAGPAARPSWIARPARSCRRSRRSRPRWSP